jgi:hypothetical protein
MKKLIYLILALVLYFYCAPKQDKVERIFEDGVEVVLNHIKPYKIKGEPNSFTLEKELFIDFAGDDIGEMGIANATHFEVDSKGNIYFFYSDKDGDVIFKFDGRGNFMTSFGPKGQGPGEIQFIIWAGIDSQDNLIISDMGNRKLLFFNPDGVLVKETRFPPNVNSLFPLDNGNYINLSNKAIDDKVHWAFTISDSKFEEIKVLDTQDTEPYDIDAQGVRGVNMVPLFKRKILKNYIYIISEDRGYEILKYDLEGNLVQRIRKEYEPVEVSDEVKQERKERYEPHGLKFWYPKYWLPICDFFLDDKGRIYVMTFERGENPREFIYDIFNPQGIYIARKSLDIYFEGDRSVYAKSIRNRLYFFQEDKDGFRKFYVYKMRWE